MADEEDPLAPYRGTEDHEQASTRIRRAWTVPGVAAELLPYSYDPRRVRRPLAEIGHDVDALSARRRAAGFRALHRQLAGVLDAAWVRWRSSPYTRGGDRRAFRAPGDVAVSAAARVERVQDAMRVAQPFPQDAAWFAHWTGHVGHGRGHGMGQLLGVAIDLGDDEAFATLERLALGRHETARFGTHVVTGLLSAARPDGWEAVVALLRAAQRQEGLRQAVLEAVDLAHPAAFRRMLDVLVEDGLTRFAATVRACSVWLGEEFEVRDRRLLDDLLARMRTYLADGVARRAALADGGADDVQLALFATSFDDAVAGGHAAYELLHDDSGDRRLAAVRHLADLQLARFAPTIGSCVRDPDLRVAAVAVAAVRRRRATTDLPSLLDLLERLPDDVTVPLGIHRPQQARLAVTEVADLAAWVEDPDVELLRQVLPRMGPDGRSAVARRWATAPQAHRDDLLRLTGDRSSHVRGHAFQGLAAHRLAAEEAPTVEDLLRRKSGDVRRGAIQLLLGQRDADVVASVERLLAGTAPQVAAAVELVGTLREEGRAADDVDRLAARALADDRVTGADREVLVGDDTERLSADVLVDHDARTPPRPPVGGTCPSRDDEDVRLVLGSLDAWLVEHRDVEVTIETWSGQQRVLVGDLRWLRRPEPGTAVEELRERTPLDELLAPWAARVLAGMDDPGHTLHRAGIALDAAAWHEQDERLAQLRGAARVPTWVLGLLRQWSPVELVAGLATTRTIDQLLPWLVAREATADTMARALADASGTVGGVAATNGARDLPDVPTIVRSNQAGAGRRAGALDWRTTAVLSPVDRLDLLRELRPDLDDDDVVGERWRLGRWIDEPTGQFDPRTGPRVPHPHAERYRGRVEIGDLPVRPARYRMPLEVLLRAYESGAATDADLDEAMLTDRAPVDTGPGSRISHFGHNSPLGELTRRSPTEVTAAAPRALARAAALRDRIVDAELGRGELPTPTSRVARQLRSVVGANRACALVAGMGRQRFVRGYAWSGGDGRKEVFSRLVRVSFPADAEDHDDFAAAAAAHGLSEARLVELAMYAPQWAPDVELTLGWDGLTDAVRWVHAHTKDTHWSVDRDVRAEWDRTTHEQTPLAPADLLAGAVDVDWFTRIRESLGDERLDRVLATGRYASSSGGHKRAQLYADALRGTVELDELVARIEDKRHKDAVRALGLLPLPDEPAAHEAAVLRRYEVLTAFDRGRRQFGQQRQASEGHAHRIGMDNLARTAGHRDAQRLSWRMEAAAVADLAAGPVVLERDDVTIALAVDDEGAPALTVRRGERTLKNVPRALAKDEQVRALRARAKSLRDQASRMRRELESAAVRGDLFPVTEFVELFDHPVLRPMLTRLVVVDGGGALGLPTPDGTGLLDAEGAPRDLGRRELRVAHPVDLLASGQWPAWQRLLFAEHLRQPFKQVFRELYVPTAEEADSQRRSTRFAGHQVQPRQAYALFGARGWVVDREGGTAVRTFHDEGVTALVTTMFAGGTVAEVEDPTVEHVWFVPRDRTGDDAFGRRPIELDAVPPRVFSEVMRDVDLVVSVAHAGEVDPEASASTVAVRRDVVRETVELLELDNVELTDNHALVTGELNTYSVHLGSAQVHRRPGNAVCIIPVGAQHRGRVFLPFVDDDPRTAEVVSKVLLLADDGAIRDPSILAQLG